MVSMESGVKIAGGLEAETLRILRALPGVTAEAAVAPDGRADVLLHAADGTWPLVVEVKRHVDAGSARMIAERAGVDAGGLPTIVVAVTTTADARRVLREAGVGVVDGAGNAHLELPGVVIHVEGKSHTSGGKRAARLSGKAGAVAQALLVGGRRSWKVTDLAEEVGVSVGLAHRVLHRLEEAEIIRAEGAGPARTRHLESPGALLDLWAEEQRDQPERTRAFLLAQTTQQLVEQVDLAMDRAGIAHALTGPAGASLVAPFVTAVPVAEVWVSESEDPDRLCDLIDADQVQDGHNLVLLQGKEDTPLRFREEVQGRWVVNRFRLYLDLLRAPQRGREQAEHLRREAIGF